MTTAWAHVVRFELAAAMRANTAGALLAVVDAAGAAWLVACGARGRWWPAPPNTTAFAWAVAALAALAVGDWVVRVVGQVAWCIGNP